MKPYCSECLLIYLVVTISKQRCVYSSECLQWTSSSDGKYRSHCYEYNQGTNYSTFEAETACKNTGGQLAPPIDEFQYEFWKTFLPPDRGETIIGVNDLVKEGVWTSFDGTPVSYLPWNPAQPNGGRDQNCVVINANQPGDNAGEPIKLQDKNCSEAFDGFLCYKDVMCFNNCHLNSVTGCFWFISDKVGWNFHEANAQCKEQDGILAPVTSFEQHNFLQRALRNFTTYTGMGSAWVGVHFIDSKYRNVNGDDFPEGVLRETANPLEDHCMQLSASSPLITSEYQPGPPLFLPCDSAKNMAGICIKSKHVHHWYTEKNFTSDAFIRAALQIDKSKTTTSALKHNTIFDGRTSSTGIGILGVSVILAVITLVIILDCGIRQPIGKKKKRKKRQNPLEHRPLKDRNKISTTKV